MVTLKYSSLNTKFSACTDCTAVVKYSIGKWQIGSGIPVGKTAHIPEEKKYLITSCLVLIFSKTKYYPAVDGN